MSESDFGNRDLLQKYMLDLEELAISQCPGTDIGRLGIGGKNTQKNKNYEGIAPS